MAQAHLLMTHKRFRDAKSYSRVTQTMKQPNCAQRGINVC